MSILNVPIQINRGTTSPLIRSLSIGEPYFDTQANTLYIKSNDSVIKVNISGESNSTRALISNSGLFNFIIDTSTCSIGGFNISTNKWTASSSNVTVGNMKVNDLRTTILTSEMYGRNFPANPSNGQLFFKLAE